MAKKTNKTAHVLNLLTKSPAAQDEGSAEENKIPAENQAAAPVAAAATVTVVDESGNEQLEKSILEQLENEVSQADSAEVKPAPAAKAKIPAAKEEVSMPEPEISMGQTEIPAVKEEVSASPTETPAAQPEAPVIKEEASVPERTEMPTVTAEGKTADVEAKDEAAPEKTAVKESSFINVMEELLKRQDINKYMEQYKVCRCERCRADVEALTLTRLPAKYVAAKSGFGTSGMNYYENKYKIRILTEIIRSCVAVREHPRHD